jgi:predicted enzyme related to lactoylglutathione lyase
MTDSFRKVTGIGGIFFKAAKPKELTGWYEKHLGIAPNPYGYVAFEWREKDSPDTVGQTIWNPFPLDTKYFAPSASPFMINYRVADLDRLVEALSAEGVAVLDKKDDPSFGKFAWIMDPEGNRIELWEPPQEP